MALNAEIEDPAARRALTDILTASGANSAAEGDLKIAGTDPVLPTVFPVAGMGAAALAACGLSLSALWKLRTGRSQSVGIELPAAAASLRSVSLMNLPDGKEIDLFDPLFGYYQAGDARWLQLHTNFPHTRDRALHVLGAAPERAAVEKAVASWEAEALEQALADAGACASFVRTREEWAAHPQGQAVAALPLLEVTKLADSDPEPLGEAARPLSGIRALDLTRVLAGPTCGRTLAEHGADVLRISGPHLPSVERCVMDTGHGKRAANIDLREQSGIEQLNGLIRGADVFCQAYRPGTLAGRGFSPEAVAALRPGIIYVTLSAYGHTGPWAERRGYDTLVQCASGIAHEQGAGPDGAPEARPEHLPGAVLDYVTGYLAAHGALHALWRRATEGGSYLVRVSLAQTSHWVKSFDRLDRGQTSALPQLEGERVSPWMVESNSAWGRMNHLGPVLRLEETPGYWERPVCRLGTHSPEWLN